MINLNINSSVLKQTPKILTQNTAQSNPIKNGLKPSLTKDIFQKSILSIPFKGTKNFDIDKAMDEIKTIDKTLIKDNPYVKYTEEALDLLRGALVKAPDKFEGLKQLTELPSVSRSIIVNLTQVCDGEHLKVAADLLGIKDESNNPKFASSSILFNANENLKYLDYMKLLADTKYDKQEINKIIHTKNIDIAKLAKNTKKIEKMCNNELYEVRFSRDAHDKNAFTITAEIDEENSKVFLLNKNMDIDGVENTEYFEDTDEQIITSTDLRNNTKSIIRNYFDEEGYPQVISETIIKRDNQGKTLKTIEISPSDINGTFNIKEINNITGKETQISKATDIDGVKSVKKDMLSLDGTRTEYEYEADENGNRISNYKITDKNGKILMKLGSTFEVIDENTFRSSKNDKTYKINFSNSKLTVTDEATDKKTTLQFKKLLKDRDKPAMINLLKKTSGDELISFSKHVRRLNKAPKIDHSCFDTETQDITTVDNLYVFMHELGHSKDFKKSKQYEIETKITSNPDVQAIYTEEKNKFLKEFSTSQRNHIDYFIDTLDHYGGEWGGLQEIVAETNAILNTIASPDIASRSQYLQQYFPKTISTIMKEFIKVDTTVA